MEKKEKPWELIRNLFYRAILAVLILISAFVLYRAIFNINSSVGNLSIYNSRIKTSDLKPIILILGIIVYITALKKLYGVFSKEYFNDKRTLMIGVGIAVMFFGALILYSHYVTVNPTYDLSHIKRTIYAVSTGNTELNNGFYYKRYPNNIALLLIVRAAVWVANLVGISNVGVVGNCLGCGALAFTAFFCFLTARKVKGNTMGLLVAAIFVTNPIFYLYSSYYYTDVMSMPFSILAIYLFVCFCKSEHEAKDYWKLAAAGIIIGMGYKVRATVIILFVAMLVWTFTQFSLKTTAKMLLVLVIGMVPIFGGFKMLYATNVIEENKSVEFPISHWLMMGLNDSSNGKYNGNDFNLTKSYETYDEKVAFNIEEIKERIKSKGISGMVIHAKEKLAIVWSDGYGIPSSFRFVENYNDVYEYCIGDRSIFLRYYAQICRASLFALMLIHFVNCIRKKKTTISVLEIALLGAFIFYLLWEANERYSISFLPWLILLMAEGVSVIERGAVIKVKNDNKVHVYRGGAVAVMAASVFFMVANYGKYTTQVSSYDEYAFVLPRGKMERQDVLVGKKVIEQEFSSIKSFNQIALLVNNRKAKRVTNYTAELYEGDVKIRTVGFTSEEVEKNGWLVLGFDTVTPQNKGVYTLKISSLNATRKNTIKVCSSYHCDEISHKTLKVNGKEQNRNLALIVSNYGEATYIGTMGYVILCILIIILESLAFSTVFRRKQWEPALKTESV